MMTDTVLTLDGLSKSFNGIKAVNELSVEIPFGRITALIGPNGSGKTTVFNLISGLLRPQAGKIRLIDSDITLLPPHKIALAGIGRTFQMIRLCSQLTVLENVMLAFRYPYGERLLPTLVSQSRIREEEFDIRERAMQCLQSVQIQDKAKAMGNELSHGQRRLVEMARALALNPKVMLLDEPMSGLSPVAIDQVKGIISETKAKGITVLFIDHDMKVVSDISEHVIVLNYGRKIAEGTVDEIRSNPEVQAAYLGGGKIAS